MTRPSPLPGVIFALALFAGLVIVPALLVNAAIWVWHLPVVGVPISLIALVLFCWAVGRWIWEA